MKRFKQKARDIIRLYTELYETENSKFLDVKNIKNDSGVTINFDPNYKPKPKSKSKSKKKKNKK